MALQKRPVSVWAISILYLLLFIANILGAITQPNVKKIVVLTSLDWGMAIIISVLGMMAAIYLFLLRKAAVKLFGAVLLLTIISCGCQHFRLLRPSPGEFTSLNMLVCLIGSFGYSLEMEKKQILF